MEKFMSIIKFVLMSFFFSVVIYSQEGEQKIVAVGVAGQAKENLLVTHELCLQNANASKNLQAIAEITRNDFSFYKHHLEIKSLPVNPPLPTLQTIKDFSKMDVQYWLQWKCSTSKFILSVFSLRQQSEVLTREWKNINSIDRALAHEIHEEVYFALFQKHALFNSKIVFSGAVEWGSRRSVKEIYKVDFDGHNLERITQHKGLALAPAFSPDNKKIIYSLIDSRKNIKNVELRELDLQSGKSTIISDRVGLNSGAVYTSDGKGIYTTLSFGGNADIYYIDFATKEERKVTSQFSEDVDPSITKDGSLMTFLSNRAGRANIYTLDPRGIEKDVKRISFVGKFNATPRFSPDGGEIVFSSWVDGGFDLYRLSLSGQTLVRLTKNFGSNEDPTYSSDGQFIVFSSRQASKGSRAVDQKIFIMNRDGEILGALTQNFKLCSSPRLSN
jgi:TolB protein